MNGKWQKKNDFTLWNKIAREVCGVMPKIYEKDCLVEW